MSFGKIGVFLADGDMWKRQRDEFKRHMLRPEASQNFPQLFNPIVADVVENLHSRAAASPNATFEFADADALLHRFAFDCISRMFFGRRFFRFADRTSETGASDRLPTGARDQQLTPVQTADAQAFIDNVMNIFRGCLSFFYLPIGVSRALRTARWRRFTRYFETLFSVAEALVADRENALRAGSTAHSDATSDAGVVDRILADKSLARDDVVASVVDIMGAAVDSTATSLQWAMYLFARNPHKQAILRDELLRVLGTSTSESAIGNEQLQQMPYLKACVKELLRLYPVIPLIGRVAQKPVEMDGYRFATGTQFNVVTVAAGRSDDIFERADQFVPERWLRGKRESSAANDEQSVSSSNETTSVEGCPAKAASSTQSVAISPEADSINRYASMAFGFGARSCIGRRVAEAELYLMIANVVRRFRVLPPEGVAPADYRVGEKWQVLLLPKTPIRVRLQLIH